MLGWPPTCCGGNGLNPMGGPPPMGGPLGTPPPTMALFFAVPKSKFDARFAKDASRSLVMTFPPAPVAPTPGVPPTG